MDRREYQRYRMNDKTFVVHDGNIGKLMDIGMGGLSCECIAEFHAARDSPALNIICMGNGMSLKELPFQMRRLTEQVERDSVTGLMMVTVRCNVKFHDLTKAQFSQIGYLISHHAVGKTCSVQPALGEQ